MGFAIGGYLLGAFAWLVKTPVLQALQNIGLGSDAGQALIAGFFGSTVMVLAVLALSFLSAT